MTAPPPLPLIVAIDGPSGTGKSSVSRAVAAALGLPYLDTGAMYRALTWWCLEQGIDLADTVAVAAAAAQLPLQMGMDPTAVSVQVAGREVEALLRESRISHVVSQVATNLAVRAELIRRQQQLIATAADSAGGVVAEGRDITTVVAPDAPVRLLLVADERARLARRAAQLHGQSDSSHLDHVRDEVLRRDRDDSRVAEFQTPASGVTLVDSSHLDFEQTVARVLTIIKELRP